MSTDFSLTDTEWKVVSEMRRLLGPNLSNYLLSGLGETNIVHCRAFTSPADSAQAEEITYRFEMRDESEGKGLPAERDLLERLQWPDTQESTARIRQALKRYFLAAYYLVDPTVGADEPVDGRYASAKRLIVGYETSGVLLPVKRAIGRGLTTVQFLPDLSYDALLGSRRFLGIDFQELRGVQEVTC